MSLKPFVDFFQVAVDITLHGVYIVSSEKDSPNISLLPPIPSEKSTKAHIMRVFDAHSLASHSAIKFHFKEKIKQEQNSNRIFRINGNLSLSCSFSSDRSTKIAVNAVQFLWVFFINFRNFS